MTTEFFQVNGWNIANIKSPSDVTAFGIATLSGSNFETPRESGISHISEHMFFKQTNTKNWKEINEIFAKNGAYNNAYTNNTEVFYFATVIKQNLDPIISVLLDMFFNSTIPAEELEKERSVIIEEKKMYDDDHSASFEWATSQAFLNWEKGHPIIGEFETIKSISRQDIIDFKNKHINQNNTVFICSGNINKDDLINMIQKNLPSEHPYINNNQQNKASNELWSPLIDSNDLIKFKFERESITQAQAAMWIQGFNATNNNYHAGNVLCEALGGGMYSALFSRIREELGLCYSTGVRSNHASYPDHNIIETFGYLSPNNIDTFIEESTKIIQDIVKNGVKQDLFECAKADYLGSLVRQTETSMGKANYLVNNYLFGFNNNIEDIIEKAKNVKIDDVNEAAQQLFTQNFNWAIMVPK